MTATKNQLAQARERRARFKNNNCPLDSGAPALNFVNTLKKRGSENPKDFLTDYENFIYWCHRAGIIDYDFYNTLNLEGYCYEAEAAEVFEQVVKTRFILYEIFLSVLKREPADEFLMKGFNAVIATSSKFLCYDSTPAGVRLVWENIAEEIAAPLWIIVHAAARLLVSADAQKIKQCTACGALFFDSTRNGARRWCSPLACGYKQKAARYYVAKKKLKAGLQDENNLAVNPCESAGPAFKIENGLVS